MKRHMCALAGLLAILLVTTGAGASGQQDKSELKKLKDEIGLVESVLNESLGQTFGAPFGYLDKARGAYLPGYGAVFTLEISLTPIQSFGPFTATAPPSPQRDRAAREEESRRREQVTSLAERVLADFGHTLSQLGPNESVAIIIHTVAIHQEKFEKSAIVLSAGKPLVDQYRANAIDRATFSRKLTRVEY